MSYNPGMRPLLLLAALALPVSAARPDTEADLRRARSKAELAVEEYQDTRAASLQRHKQREALRKDLRYVAEELDRERLGERQQLAAHSAGCLARLDHLKRNGRLDRRLYDPAENPPDPDKVIARLERICRELPSKTYAEQYPRGLIKAIATELREAAESPEDDAAVLALLRERLVLPEQRPGEEDAFTSLALFPVDIPEARFRKLGAIRIFLVKHRLKRPRAHARTDWSAIASGAHNAQIGVEIEGLVVRHGGAIDGDYTFDIGDLHIEMTPEWRLAHPGIPKPRKGDRVRVRGWTYVDVFHKAEMEYDPADPVLGANRVTQWEIHPVQDVEILAAAAPAPAE